MNPQPLGRPRDELREESGLDVPRLLARRYRVEECVGRGASSVVYAAFDEWDETPVAVKFFLSARESDVRREVLALHSLRVPGVVRIVDEGVDEGRRFLVTELIDGRPFPGTRSHEWADIHATARSFFSALAEVHAAGVVHRDLKPANVLARADSSIVITDFGLSDVGDLDGLVSAQTELRGTPFYMSPEGLKGEAVTSASDLYATGVMLFEALTGKLPHAGTTLRELLRARLSYTSGIREELARHAPDHVVQCVSRLLAVRPGERPLSAGEALANLDDCRPAQRFGWPRLGSDECLKELRRAAQLRHAVSVSGEAGSGKTRLFAELARSLRAERVEVVSACPADEPLQSLVPVIGELESGVRASLADVTEEALGRLRQRLKAGCVVLVDELRQMDPVSRDVLERARPFGAVLCVDAATAELRLGRLSRDELRPLFAGHDRLLHEREDASHALWRRTDGLPRAIVNEVSAWVRSGAAHWQGTKLRVGRTQIERLLTAGLPIAGRGEGARHGADLAHDELLAWIALAQLSRATTASLATARGEAVWRLEAKLRGLVERGEVVERSDGSLLLARDVRIALSREELRRAHQALGRSLDLGAPGRLFHLIAAGDLQSLALEAGCVAERYLESGRPAPAEEVLAETVRALRSSRSSPSEDEPNGLDRDSALSELFEIWAEAAVSVCTAKGFQRLLFELDYWQGKRANALGELVQAGLQIASSAPARAYERLLELEPFRSERLETTRHVLAVMATQSLELALLEQALERFDAWVVTSGSRLGAARLARSRGVLEYRQGQYRRAARSFTRAAELEPDRARRVGALLSLGSALIECRRHASAERVIKEARELAESSRHVQREANAVWLERTNAYRQGKELQVDEELVAAAGRIGSPHFQGLIYLCEAAIAWRAGDERRAAELARAVGSEQLAPRDSWTELLATALGMAAQSFCHAIDTERLRRSALSCSDPGCGRSDLGALGHGRGADSSHRVRESRAAARARRTRAPLGRAFTGLRLLQRSPRARHERIRPGAASEARRLAW